MSVDYIDLQSRIMRRVFFISMMRRLREPLTGSLFLLGVALMLLFSAVSAVNVFLNAWKLPTLIDSFAYVVSAFVSTELSVQIVLAVALAAAIYVAARACISTGKTTLKVAMRSLRWTKIGVRRITTSVLAGRIVIG